VDVRDTSGSTCTDTTQWYVLLTTKACLAVLAAFKGTRQFYVIYYRERLLMCMAQTILSLCKHFMSIKGQT